QESAEPHDDNRNGEHRLAANLVAEMAEDRGTQRPGQEADGIGAEGGNGRQRRITSGEKDLVEHQRGRGTVDQEVVPLDGGADHARPQDTPQTCGVVRDANGGETFCNGHRSLLEKTCSVSGAVFRSASRLPPRCSSIVSGIFAGWFSRPSVDVGARGAAATAA